MLLIRLLSIEFNFKRKIKIYDAKLKWTADPKIDSHNEQVIEQIKNAPKPVVRLF